MVYCVGCGLGFRVQGLGFWAWGCKDLGCRVYGIPI